MEKVVGRDEVPEEVRLELVGEVGQNLSRWTAGEGLEEGKISTEMRQA